MTIEECQFYNTLCHKWRYSGRLLKTIWPEKLKARPPQVDILTEARVHLGYTTATTRTVK